MPKYLNVKFALSYAAKKVTIKCTYPLQNISIERNWTKKMPQQNPSGLFAKYVKKIIMSEIVYGIIWKNALPKI
jgi:hypothetical protein